MLKTSARGAATVCALPWLLVYWLKIPLLGRDLALEGSSESLSRIPGLLGKYLRRAFLACVLAECHPTASIGFGVLFSKVGARIGANVYIGPRCHLGLVTIERDALLAAGTHVTSGTQTHGYDDLSRPIRDQEGTPTRVCISTWPALDRQRRRRHGGRRSRHDRRSRGPVVTKAAARIGVIAAGVPARAMLRSRLARSGQRKSRLIR